MNIRRARSSSSASVFGKVVVASFPSASHPPNKSFKPRPLRGSAHALSCSTTPCRKAVRLNSGVRRRFEQFSLCDSRYLIVARISRHLPAADGFRSWGFGHIFRANLISSSIVGRASLRTLEHWPLTGRWLSSGDNRLPDLQSQSRDHNRFASRSSGVRLTIRSSRRRFVASPLRLRYASAKLSPLRGAA